MKTLVAGGVTVRLMSGTDKRPHYAAVGRVVGGTGNQHSNLVHTDRGSIVGSSNLTTSSRANHECSVHFTLHPGSAMAWRYELSAYIASGEELETAETSKNIQRYCGGRRSKSQGARTLALSEAFPGGFDSA